MKIVFFGSSEFSIPSLEVCRSTPHELLAVVTTPDKPKGRGLLLQPNSVKKRCDELGILTFVPPTLKNLELEKLVGALRPDFFVVASYGKLIPASWLKIPHMAAWNIHPSLLPKYRGAAPIPWQIIHDEKETGVSVALVTPELDAGDIIHQIRIRLERTATTESLTQELAELSARVLREAFERLGQGKLKPTPQDPSQSSYARKITKEDGYLNLQDSAGELERKIRAFHPWPAAFIRVKKVLLRLVEVQAESPGCAEAKPGTLLEISPSGYLRIQAGAESLKVFKVQLPGRRIVAGSEFVHGQRLKPGFVFENFSENPSPHNPS